MAPIDLCMFAAAYESKMGDPNYNRLADLDYNCDVDDTDLAIFQQNCGKQDPSLLDPGRLDKNFHKIIQ